MRWFCCLWLVLSLDVIERHALAERIDFNRDIRPILSDKCFQCHGPDAEARETDLRLDVEDSAKADLGGYVAVANGDPAASELIVRITTSDESERMPPIESGKLLSASQIELLRRWIAEGAIWSPAWSYVTPRRWELPTVINQHWVRNWIDRFILAQLETEDLLPTEQTDPVTLIRRLSFDLTGLPPRPELVARYIADHSEAAYSSIVDELLASPHFGERMAMYWLDLVRFADTVGYHGDQDHNIWPYRDYVIDAFSDNMPFDQFTREQLAGDLLPTPTSISRLRPVTTGSCRHRTRAACSRRSIWPFMRPTGAQRLAVWMGATVGCAQCHDHKFDPYTTRDFYSLAAFFADIDGEHHLRDETTRRQHAPHASPEIGSAATSASSWLLLEQTAGVGRSIEGDAAVSQAPSFARNDGSKARTMVVESSEPRRSASCRAAIGSTNRPDRRAGGAGVSRPTRNGVTRGHATRLWPTG